MKGFIWFMVWNTFLYLITLPVKIVLAIINLFVFKPKMDHFLFQKDGDIHEKYKKFEAKIPEYIATISKSSDQGKFGGILVAATENEEHYKQLTKKQFTEMSGYLLRVPWNPEYRKNWTGDQDSGFLYALAVAYKKGWISDEDKIFLRATIKKAIYTKPYWQWNNPSSKATNDRGFLFPWWAPGNYYVSLMSVLKVYSTIVGGWKLKLWYYFMSIITAPMVFLAPETFLLLGRTYVGEWYDPHSVMLSLATMVKLGSKLHKIPMSIVAKKHAIWSPDIAVLYNKYVEYDEGYDRIIRMYLDDYTDKYLELAEYNKTKYCNLTKIQHKDKRQPIFSIDWLSSRFRSWNYDWEKNPLDNDRHSENKVTQIDYLHLYKLYVETTKT